MTRRPVKVSGSAQQLPAGDEGLQDHVAQVWLMIEQVAKCIGRQLINFAVAPGDGFDQCRAAGHLCYFARESARPVHRDYLGGIPSLVDNRDLARFDDKKIAVAIPVVTRTAFLPLCIS